MTELGDSRLDRISPLADYPTMSCGYTLTDHVKHRRKSLCDECRNTYALVHRVVESSFFLDRSQTSRDYRRLGNPVADSLCALTRVPIAFLIVEDFRVRKR